MRKRKTSASPRTLDAKTRVERERDRKAQKEKERLERLKRDVNTVLETESGKRVFGYLFRLCGYSKSGLSYDRQTGGIDPVTTTLNDARRDIYATLRSLASPGLRAKAEALAEKLIENEETTDA